MQTFLPHSDFAQSAAVLDYRRLGSQVHEVSQILDALHETNNGGYRNHPVTKMWRGHELQLAQFGLVCEEEWERRGYKVRVEKQQIEQHMDWARDGDMSLPEWFGGSIHLRYQRLLLWKNYAYYSKFFPGVLPYGDKDEFYYPEGY
jgi:hypothetical protein